MTSCDAAGIGAAVLQPDDGSSARILEVSTGTGTAGEVPYCLVKVLVPQAINIWVGLPMAGEWNGRWQSVGGGGYAGTVSVPTAALAAATTDTGHTAQDGGRFGMLAPGELNVALQQDFAYRSEHLMAERDQSAPGNKHHFSPGLPLSSGSALSSDVQVVRATLHLSGKRHQKAMPQGRGST